MSALSHAPTLEGALPSSISLPPEAARHQLSQFPYVRQWDVDSLPRLRRVIRPTSRRRLGRDPGPEDVNTGPWDRPFDFCDAMRCLCADVATRCKAFEHIDVDRLLFATTQARNCRLRGLQARVTPLRFPHGQLFRRRRNMLYQVQRYCVDGREMLYVVTFCMPRFLDQGFEEKLITIFHELYHIGPRLDGDLRRLGDRYAMHSHSKRGYDVHMAQLSRAYLADGADPRLYAFLKLSFAQLQARHGQVVGTAVPRPKLIPLAAVKA